MQDIRSKNIVNRGEYEPTTIALPEPLTKKSEGFLRYKEPRINVHPGTWAKVCKFDHLPRDSLKARLEPDSEPGSDCEPDRMKNIAF